MDRQFAARRNRALGALMGGSLLCVALGAAPLSPALADDDNWHTEADRPLALQEQIRDRDEILAGVIVRAEREEVYAPLSAFRIAPPVQYIESVYQTADVDQRR